MLRKVQLWRWYGSSGAPGQSAVPTSALHSFLLGQRPADLSLVGAGEYETHLVPVPGSDPHLILYRVRNQGLPSERRSGQVVELDPNVNELAEGSHFLFLPRNLLAFMGSGFGPRPSRLAEWMRERVGWDLRLEPVLRPNAGEILNHLERVAWVEIKVPADEVRNLDLSGFFQGANDPLGALKTMQQAQHGGVITLGFSVGRDRHANQAFLTKLLKRMRGAPVDTFTKAQAKVYVEHADSATIVDFLHDRVAAEVEIDDPGLRQRLIPPPEALNAMKTAWKQFKEADKVLDFVDPPSSGNTLLVPPALVPAPAGG